MGSQLVKAQVHKLAHELGSHISIHVSPLVIFIFIFFNLCNSLISTAISPSFIVGHLWLSPLLPLPIHLSKPGTVSYFLTCYLTHTHSQNLYDRRELVKKPLCAERSCTPRYMFRSSNVQKLKAAKEGVSSVCEPLPADRPVWFPGTSPPQWLDGRSIHCLFFSSSICYIKTLTDYLILNFLDSF